MTADLPDNALELRSLVTSQGTLELSLHDIPLPRPAANEVLVRVEASPINPSDLGLLIAGADMTTATVAGTPERPIVTASLGAGALGGLSARADKPLPVGNEGAGIVVAAGSSSAAQALLGRRVEIELPHDKQRHDARGQAAAGKPNHSRPVDAPSQAMNQAAAGLGRRCI